LPPDYDENPGEYTEWGHAQPNLDYGTTKTGKKLKGKALECKNGSH
jgi:AAA+ superfamily predicted ATPase